MLTMKKTTLASGVLVLATAFSLNALAQTTPNVLSKQLEAMAASEEAHEKVAAFIYLKDKGSNIDKKLLEAKSALSQRALHRRMINRGADNVVDESDIPVDAKYLDTITSKVSTVRHVLKSLNAISVEATPAELSELTSLPFIKEITRVKTLKRKPDPVDSPSILVPSLNELLAPTQVNMLDYGNSFTQVNQINVPAVHDMGYDGSGVVIAIFDSGFNRLTHEAFDEINIAGTWDFVNGDSDVGDGGMGTGSHGTNTLSTVGGYSPGDLIGPAYRATYYLAKTENTESELHIEEDNWCAAAEWAEENGADIITSSLGYNDFDRGGDYSPSDMDGDTAIVTICADNAAENGIVVINSAGNSGNSSQNTLGAPSDGHFVLAVGAVTSSGSRSSFSSVGLSADGRIKPDVMAMGSSVRVASASSNTRYSSVNGTSFSCPLTAGVAALVLQANPDLSAAQVRDILRNTADRASNPDRFFGYGIINAEAAVEAALGAELNASFNYSATELSVSFSDTSSTPSGEIRSWNWSFGDGNTSSLQNPVYTYASAGSYDVSLTVTNSENETDTVTETVTVSVIDPSDCSINFTNTSDNYSNSSPGSAEVSNGGCTITLTGNEWRITDEEFEVTANTVITFDFSTSGSSGEIQGVGFDADSGASSNRIFQLTGTQNWGIRDFNYNGGTQTISIPVGEYYTGTGMSFVIANDKDSGATTNSVTVSNVRISN
ncbi:S8 family serine peptidase [Marinibactrum halimedae]|uniref:PKD domain-containing protein n=1 Tax=Marinibactrum halimedae TaxID=1444977 RepID=A0AA37T9Y8_9GAMM|nr:S8 family serine peptidase [Marinibactrum halimedae]MCD9458515.1 S8 family serine peptidase [Marinibactrum halimedae]GLS26621.1 hypothetical protein GCM10007877_23370 [Marinibactrum halimedae]